MKISNIARTREIEVDGHSSFATLLPYLFERFGTGFRESVMEGDKISSKILILLNGISIKNETLQELETPLKPDDEIAFIPMLNGG